MHTVRVMVLLVAVGILNGLDLIYTVFARASKSSMK